LLPLRVIALTTPPEKRPYSAEIPDVRTCVSSMASSMKRLCGVPNRLSVTSTPFTMKLLSNAKAPLIEICPTFGVASFTAGDKVEMP
jgi:hypothetical protein